MENKELVQKLRDFLKDKESVDGNAAPALHLMRHALLALERPAVTEVRQEVLEDTATADLLEEREGFIYGLLAELQLIPEVDGEPVETLADAIAADSAVLDDLLGEIVRMFSQWDDFPDKVKDKDIFIGAVCNLLQLNGETPLRDVWSALQAKSTYLSSLEIGIANRDQVIEELEHGAHVINAPDPQSSISMRNWCDGAMELAHAVRRDRSLENRLMAKAADNLIASARDGWSE